MIGFVLFVAAAFVVAVVVSKKVRSTVFGTKLDPYLGNFGF